MKFRPSAPIGLAALILLAAPARGADLHGRVIDRGTLTARGAAKGIPGVRVSLYDGKKLIGTAITGPKGAYKIRKVPVPDFKAIYQVRGWQPAQTSRVYHLSAGDTAARDIYVDAAPREKPAAGKPGKGGYYSGLARGFLNLTRQESFFRESQEDSLIDLSAFFDGRDSTADYKGAMCELLWAEFLSQDRALETRYYLASALSPLLDSLGWGRLLGMKRYLDVTPEAVRAVADGMRESIRNPKKLPTPKDIRKAKAPLELASQIASELLSDPDLSEKAKDRFLAQWKKAWGKEAPSHRDEGDEEAFLPNALIGKLAAARSGNAAAQYLKGRGLFAVRDYTGAADALGYANRIQGSHPAARHLEAMAFMRLGREQEALGRFQALREAADPYWKAQAYYGLGLLDEKEKRHSEAAANLWKAVRLSPKPELMDLLAEVSLKLTARGEIETLLQQRAAKGDHRAHFWLGRYGEEDHQSGVAEDHYRKAWEASPSPEYAEALGRLHIAREEYAPALNILAPLRAHLSPEGRLDLAECLLQAGRSMDASREFAAAYVRKQTPEVLARYVEALVQANRSVEALAVVKGFPDQGHPKVRFALAKANLGNHEPAQARPILEELVKQEENNADYHHNLGLCYFEDRNWSKAMREFDETLKYRQDHLEAIYYTGLVGVKLGRADGARNYFNELAQRTSAEWKARGLLGVGISFAAQDKPEAAENFYQRSLLIVETAEAQALLALSKRRLGGAEKWAPLARRAFEMDNRHPKAVVAWGEALLAQGKKRAAIKHFQEALIDNPNSCDLLAGMAKCQFLTGAYQAGRGTSDKAISLCPQEPESYYYAGVSADKTGNRSEAKDFFKAYRKAGGDMALLPENYR